MGSSYVDMWGKAFWQEGIASANAPRLEWEEIVRDKVLILSSWFFGVGEVGALLLIETS